jgi:membrane protein
MPPLDLAQDTIRAFQRNGLPDLASAMAFQAILAIVPFLLFVLALTGLVDLEEIWREDVSPDVRAAVSRSAFELIDDTVDQIVGQRQLWWLTAGLALTLWELSAATRVAMTALDRVYGYYRAP